MAKRGNGIQFCCVFGEDLLHTYFFLCRDNVDWICVSKPRESRDDLDQRVAAMVEAWEDIEISGSKV